MMGYKTPNIDSLAKEGALFTDWYGQQSCTAGRAAFITGQSPIRTGLTKVGLPGAPEGLKKEDPTLADLLKPLGLYDRAVRQEPPRRPQRMLPTVHGFDEFFGNLYHLNAEEEPENPDYPKDPSSRRCSVRAACPLLRHDQDDPPDPRFGRVGKQKCEDTGPLTRKRMETIDEEITKGALGFMDKAAQGRQAVLRLVELHPHARLHAPEAGLGRQDRPRRLRRRHGRARRAWWASCSPSSRNWASRTTPSSCTPPTTAPRPSPGPTAARRCSAARRTPIGKAAIGCPPSSAGPA